jgi:hypothetical protein
MKSEHASSRTTTPSTITGEEINTASLENHEAPPVPSRTSSGLIDKLQNIVAPIIPPVPQMSAFSRGLTTFRAAATSVEARFVTTARLLASPSLHKVNRENKDFLQKPIPIETSVDDARADGASVVRESTGEEIAGDLSAERLEHRQAYHQGLTPYIMRKVEKRILQIIEHAYLPNTAMALDNFWGSIRQHTDLNPDPVPKTVPEIVAGGLNLAMTDSAVNRALQSEAMQNIPFPNPKPDGKLGSHDLNGKNFIDKLSWATLSQMRLLPDDEATRQQVIVNGWCQYTNEKLAEVSQGFLAQSMDDMNDAAGSDGSIPHDHPVWKQLEKGIDRLLKDRDSVINEALEGTLAEIGNYPGFTQDSQKLLRSKVARYYRELLTSPARATFVLNLANTFFSALPPAGKAVMIIPKAVSVIVAQAATQSMPGRLAATGAYAKLGQMNEVVPNYDVGTEYAHRTYGNACKEIAKTMTEIIPQKISKAVSEYKGLAVRLSSKVNETDFPLVYALQAWDKQASNTTDASEANFLPLMQAPSFWTQQSADDKKEAILNFLKKYEQQIATMPDGLATHDKLQRLFDIVADRKQHDGEISRLSPRDFQSALEVRIGDKGAMPTADFIPDQRHALLVFGQDDLKQSVVALGNNIGALTQQERASYGSDEALKAIRMSLYGYQVANTTVSVATVGAVGVASGAATAAIGPMGAVLVGAAGVVVNYLTANFLRNLAGEAWSMLAKDGATKNKIYEQTQALFEAPRTPDVTSPATWTKDPSQQREALVKDMVSDIVARLETKAAATQIQMGKQLVYGLHMRYKRPDDSGNDFMKRLSSISDFARADSTIKVKKNYATLVTSQSGRLGQLEIASGASSMDATNRHTVDKRIMEMERGADNAQKDISSAREGVKELHAEIRSMFELYVNDILASPEAFVSRSEFDALSAILNAPSAAIEDSAFLDRVSHRLERAGKLNLGAAESGIALHNDKVPYPDANSGATMQGKAEQAWQKAYATSQTSQRHSAELLQNYAHFLNGHLDEMTGYGADLLKKVVTATPEYVSVIARRVKNLGELGVARAGAKWYSSVVGGPLSVGSVLSLAAIGAGTAIDIAGVTMQGLGNVKVGSITVDNLKPKALRFDILALCPTLLPAAAAVWPGQLNSAPAQFGNGNYYLALCNKADRDNAGPVFLLINKATGMVAELPEPSREQFAELMKGLEQSTKMSAMNPASNLYRFKSTYEKEIIAKHPDYRDGLKVAQKLTAPHRIKEFLKTAFDVKGVYRMLGRLHHNESRDAARAELTLKLTEQYLMQLDTFNAAEVVKIQDVIGIELDKIWNNTMAPVPDKDEAETLGDNVSTPVLTRRAPLYTKPLRPHVSLIKEESIEETQKTTLPRSVLSKLRSMASNPLISKNSNANPPKFEDDLDAHFAKKITHKQELLIAVCQ